MSELRLVHKAAIIGWGLLGAALGWLVAAIAFLRRFDRKLNLSNSEPFFFLLALTTMLGFSLYGARRYPALYHRIICTIFGGGTFLFCIAPSCSFHEPDRVVSLLKGFDACGHFSGMHWGLVGAVFFLAIVVGIAPSRAFVPPGSAEVSSANSEEQTPRRDRSE